MTPTPSTPDREQAIQTFLDNYYYATARERCDPRALAERIVDALLYQPDLRAKLDDMQLHDDTGDPCDEGYMAAVNELRTWLDSEGGDAEDRVPGQPDPEVERLQRAVEYEKAVGAELNEELTWQIERADRAEERLRAVTEAARRLVKSLDPWDMLPKVRDAREALIAVLSEEEGT